MSILEEGEIVLVSYLEIVMIIIYTARILLYFKGGIIIVVIIYSSIFKTKAIFKAQKSMLG